MTKFLTSVNALLCVWLVMLAFMQNAVAGTVTGQVQTPSGGPFANATFSFTLTQPALVSGTATVAPATVNCYTDANGNVVGEPNPLVIPTVSANLASGTLGANTYFVVITYFDGTGETVASPEATLILSSTGTLVVTAPTRQPTGATGYKVYISTSRGTETLQGSVTGTPGSWGNFSQASALVAGAALPSSNATSCKMRFNDELQPSFVCYDVGLISSSGSTLPGYPQYWYLSGGSGGTVNIGVGTPQSTVCQGAGVVYPQAIIAQPAAGATQSISGGLDLGVFSFGAGSGTFKGPLTVSGPRPWVDVTGIPYLALCNGVTDDTAAIQSALTAAAAIGGTAEFPDGKTCVVQSSSSPALNLDEQGNAAIVCGVPSWRSRPGGGTTLSCVINFTGTPAIGLAARANFGVGVVGMTLEATNAAFTGTILTATHFPGDIRCGGNPCDTENFVVANTSINGVGTSCSVGLDLDKVITSGVYNNHFFGCVSQLRGASGAGSYSNVISVESNDFNASSSTTSFILNGGEAWSVIGNSFEVNGSSAATLGNNGFTDLIGLEWVGNWDGDDTGPGGQTKYSFNNNTSAHFAGNFASSTHASTNMFSVGTNTNITIENNSFAGGSTMGTVYNLGASTGVNLVVGPNQYGTFSTLINGTPSSGYIFSPTTGRIHHFGTEAFSLPTNSAPLATVHARSNAANTGTVGGFPTITGAGVIGDAAPDVSGAGGNGKAYGVIGVARALNSTGANERAYAGWFKSQGFTTAAEEVGVHAETGDSASGTTPLEIWANNLQQARFDGQGSFYFNKLLISSQAPTISSGFGTGASVTSNNGPGSFTINVGTGGTATNGVIGLPTATTGWNCTCEDITTTSATVNRCKQTASSTTSATIGNFNTTPALAAWVASDILNVSCLAR